MWPARAAKSAANANVMSTQSRHGVGVVSQMRMAAVPRAVVQRPVVRTR